MSSEIMHIIICQQPISIMTEFLNFCQDGANTSAGLGNIMKIDDTLVE
jgi:hypothetical protein